ARREPPAARCTEPPASYSRRRHACGVERGPIVARGETRGEGERRGQVRSPRGTDTPRSLAPPESDIELAMDMVAVWAGVSRSVVVLEGFEFDLLVGAQCLQHSIETLPRPLEQLAQPRDEDALVVVADAIVGGLKLLPERVGLEETCELLL